MPTAFPRPNIRSRHSLLALWHLLSLDAPTVAVTWTWTIARAANTSLPAVDLFALFLAVWILYAADRLLDARRGIALEERHYFHHRHRRILIPALIAATLALAACIRSFTRAEINLYAALGTFLCIWLLQVHVRLKRPLRLPKELAVGFFFAAAVFIPTVARAPQLRLALFIPALLFAAVSALNTLFIYRWEHPFIAAAHPSSRFALARLRPLTTATAAIALAVFVETTLLAASRNTTLPAHLSTLALASALAAVLLLTLDRFRDRLSPVHLRALADAALLTPLLTTLLR